MLLLFIWKENFWLTIHAWLHLRAQDVRIPKLRTDHLITGTSDTRYGNIFIWTNIDVTTVVLRYNHTVPYRTVPCKVFFVKSHNLQHVRMFFEISMYFLNTIDRWHDLDFLNNDSKKSWMYVRTVSKYFSVF